MATSPCLARRLELSIQPLQQGFERLADGGGIGSGAFLGAYNNVQSVRQLSSLPTEGFANESFPVVPLRRIANSLGNADAHPGWTIPGTDCVNDQHTISGDLAILECSLELVAFLDAQLGRKSFRAFK